MSSTEITRSIDQYDSHDEPMHHWTLTEDGEAISHLWVAIETGEIMQVETIPSRRGEGLARALYAQAASEIDIYHAPESHRTPDGDAFAHAVGGDARPCTLGCCTDDDEE